MISHLAETCPMKQCDFGMLVSVWVAALNSFAQSKEKLPPKVEGAEEDKSMQIAREAAGSGELLSRVQELEDELKDSEHKRMDLIHNNTALQNKLKVIREEKASLEGRLLSVQSSQVKLDIKEGLMHQQWTKHALLQVEQLLPTHTSPSTPPHPPFPKPRVEGEVEELAARIQQAEYEKLDLMMEKNALHKKLIGQKEKYNHDMMAVITQVCSSTVPNASFLGVLCLLLHGHQSSFVPSLPPLPLSVMCEVFSVQLSSLSLFYTTEPAHLRCCCLNDVGSSSKWWSVSCAAVGEDICQCGRQGRVGDCTRAVDNSGWVCTETVVKKWAWVWSGGMQSRNSHENEEQGFATDLMWELE